MLATVAAWGGSGVSYYTSKPADEKAVEVEGGDGAALQAAIDKVAGGAGEGIVFLPEGRYRITQTVYVWPGIRVIGYGKKRPVLVLENNTPGYQDGIGAMVFFAGFRPGGRALPAGFRMPPPPPGSVPPASIPDANPGTFYSGMSNVDFEIGEGNAGAVAVRAHFAQHGILAHMDFRLGSALAGIHDAGNTGEDLHFRGGRYGILTKKPSPAWPYTLIDSTFEGQRGAAIRTNEAQLTLLNVEFRNVSTAVEIDKGYAEQLWMKGSRMENVTGPAVLISNENSRLTQINLEDVDCKGVPVFAQFRESGKKLTGPAETYRVKALAHGLTLAGMGAVGETRTKFDASPVASMPAKGAAWIAATPPVESWVNVRTLGLKGDGKSDDTAALKKAVAEHRVLYFPMGHYVVTDTIELRPETVLIALHPDETQLDVLDGTPAFQPPGGPKPILLAPKGGKNLVTGIGLYTGGINGRALGAMWMAGAESLMADVRFLGGHGTRGPDGKRESPYNGNLSGDPNPQRKWDSQYHSLWVTHGGGGTFFNLWTPSTFAQSGLYISDTKTPGKVIMVSSEHHVRTEAKLDQVENWDLYALQTEGERWESEAASALEISRSRNITVANFHGYRVTRSQRPFPYAVRVTDSREIRFRNVHVDANSSAGYCPPEGACRQIVRASKFSYATCILDPDTGEEVRDREFAYLDYAGAGKRVRDARVARVNVERLATGFFHAGGGTADAAGRLYFTDTKWHRIYRLTPETKKLEIVRDHPMEPVNLVFGKAGNLMVVSSVGTGMAVYAFQPDGPEDAMQVIAPQPAAERPGMTAVLPPSYWVNGDFTNTLSPKTYEYVTLEQMFFELMQRRKKNQYVSPDGTTYIPTDDVFVQGPWHLGYKWAHVLQGFGLAKATPGQTFYVTNEAEQKTYRGKVNADGTLAGLELFATQGGESVAVDSAGRVYLAAGHVFVYSAAGKLLEVIETPERPLNLTFGGKDGKTLLVVASGSVYGVRR